MLHGTAHLSLSVCSVLSPALPAVNVEACSAADMRRVGPLADAVSLVAGATSDDGGATRRQRPLGIGSRFVMDRHELSI